ncbi:hypothetical protein ACEPPN_001689 [Leptodophora sp. 'Broadleaf-Isolate-01']
MHLQSQSKLLSAPLEIRRAIYTQISSGHLHALRSQSKFRFSGCLQPNLGDSEHAGYERRVSAENDDASQAQWARRLSSSWGPHWECEELALAKDKKLCGGDLYKLGFVCKKTFLDICDLVAESSVINVTDLDILQSNPDDSSPSWNLWDHIRPRVQVLNVALRLPVAFYTEMEGNAEVQDEAAGRSTTAVSTAYTNWMHFWVIICGLQQLRKLNVWLDHDDESSWSVVKERQVLTPVFAILATELKARSAMCDVPAMQFLFNLPKLHPGIAKPETHFVEEIVPPSIMIKRRYRQRYHRSMSDDGALSVAYKSDFPIMHEIADFYSNESLGAIMIPVQEFEEIERNLWLTGQDVHREIRELTSLNGFSVCYF